MVIEKHIQNKTYSVGGSEQTYCILHVLQSLQNVCMNHLNLPKICMHALLLKILIES